MVTRRLRVLTYNVQFRSWGMELGAQGSLTPYTSVEERAKQICERILTRPEPWDVLLRACSKSPLCATSGHPGTPIPSDKRQPTY